ncbi:NAD-dependent deacylase [bacterium]|nr:NAD-dependent deacylase [bacterium]
MIDESLIRRLKASKKVAVLTGAGVSAESGVPTFRGEEGMWKKFKPEELANFDAFMRNPDMVWEWYEHRKDLMSKVKPNAGHYAMAKMEKLFPVFTLITQNIDNLHRIAGSENILELHGNIRRNFCINCKKQYNDEHLTLGGGKVPKCSCGGMIRPDVVWFGEMLPGSILESAFKAAETCDFFLSLGTSAVVYPAAMLPVAAKKAGAVLLEINPETTPLTQSTDYYIKAKTGEVLPQIVEAIIK